MLGTYMGLRGPGCGDVGFCFCHGLLGQLGCPINEPKGSMQSAAGLNLACLPGDSYVKGQET